MNVRPWVRRRFPVAVNHRGRHVPVWLGTALTAVLALWIGIGSGIAWLFREGVAPWRRDVLWTLLAVLAVFTAGLYDDYRPARTRGVLRQLRLLARGTVTSGVVKLVVIAAAAAFACWALHGRGWRLALGVPVVAGSANLWNLLDVSPGRAIKFFVPVAVALAPFAHGPDMQTLLPAAIGAALGALVVDLREWGMLGDGGSNVLGFIVGMALFETLSVAGLAVSLAAILALHVLSETVTLSRAIAAIPPLRSFDRLGQVRPGRAQEPEGRTGPATGNL